MHIEAHQLTKTYGKRTLVNRVTINITPGKVLGLLGPNGAGKSTTIKMLTGQIRPSSGSISIDNKEYSHFPESYRSNLGIVPQEIIIWEDLTLEENLRFSATLYKLTATQAQQRITQLIEDLKLQPERKTRAKNLSGGYKRRLNLAISIIHDPKVIVLDEPTPGIDAQSRNLLSEYIAHLVATGRYSVVLTDHYLDEAEKLSDYVVIIDEGSVVTEGTVPQLKQKHGNGNLLQIDLEPGQLESDKEQEKILKSFKQHFPDISFSKSSLVTIVPDTEGSLSQALAIVREQHVEVLNVSVKEPTLEDIFLLLTGKEVRE
ncbi:MAG: ATP-binding cassette domain-containing protein [Candidatus Dojkabacteria bacterium]